MRQFFVPACVCLLIGGGTIGPEVTRAKIQDSLPEAVTQIPAPSGEATADAPVTADAPAQSTDDSRAAIARDAESATRADVPIEIPQQVAIQDLGEPVPAVLPPLKPIVKPIVQRSRQEICDSLTDAAHSNGLPAPFIIRLLYQESGFRPGVVSRAGAEGIAQFMPETAARRGLENPYDPLQAIDAAARFLRDLAQRFGNLGLAAAAYNAGPKRIADWLAKKGNLPQETQDYVKNITGRPAERWTVAAAGSPAMKLPRRAPCQEAAGLLAWDGPDHIPMPPTRNTASPMARGAAKLAAPREQRIVKRHGKMIAVAAGDGAAAKDTGTPKIATVEASHSSKHAKHARLQLASADGAMPAKEASVAKVGTGHRKHEPAPTEHASARVPAKRSGETKIASKAEKHEQIAGGKQKHARLHVSER